MPTERQRKARVQDTRERVERTARTLQDNRRKPVVRSIPLKGKAASEILLISSDTRLRSTLSPLTVALAMAQQPGKLLEVPVVDKKGAVTACWLRAGAIAGVVDLTGMREWPQ